MEGLLNGSVALWQTLPDWLRGLIRALRPKQWSKNGLIFLPLLFDRKISISNPEPALRVGLAFLLFCMAASSIYLVNDIVDRERDKLHPKKKNRPIASGQLPFQLAVGMATITPPLTLALAWWLSPSLAIVLLVYIIKQLAYSFKIKEIVIMDVMFLAAGYVLRVIAGVVVITVTNFSPWLYVCTGALSLFLAVAKRRQELIMLGSAAQDVRPTYREYTLPLLDDMLRLVISASVISYTLYTVEARTSFGGPMMLLTVPIVIYGIFRYMYLMHVQGKGGAPDELLFEDRPLLFTSILYLIVAAAIIYIRVQ